MVNLIGNVHAVVFGILLVPVADALHAVKYGRIRNVFLMPEVASISVLILIGTKALMKLLKG
jgi:hypothetical protein